MSKLVIANLKQRPTRTIVSILAVAIGVVLVLTVVGLSQGLLNDAAQRTQNIGADIIFQPTGASLLFALSTGTMPLKLMYRLLEIPGVEAATPVLSHFSARDFGLVFGIDPDSFSRFSGRLQVLEGRTLADKYDIIVDDTYAKARNLKVGDTVELLGGHKFRVVGVYRSGVAVRVFMQLRTMQEIRGAEGQASMIFIKCGSPELVNRVYAQLRANFPGYTITKSQDVLDLMSSNLPGLKEFTLSVIFVSMLVSFLVVLLAMYTTIFERTHDIGILKALGASRLFIVGEMLKESMLISGFGIMVGFALTYVLREALVAAFPTLLVDISPAWMIKAGLLGIVGGTLGALYPAFRAAGQDAVEALSYE